LKAQRIQIASDDYKFGSVTNGVCHLVSDGGLSCLLYLAKDGGQVAWLSLGIVVEGPDVNVVSPSGLSKGWCILSGVMSYSVADGLIHCSRGTPHNTRCHVSL
jgi:hypothetical protein